MGPPGERFGTPGVPFWQSREVVLAPLGTIWATQGSPGDPVGDKVEKRAEKVVRGPSPGPPPGTHFDTFSKKTANGPGRRRFCRESVPDCFFAVS